MPRSPHIGGERGIRRILGGVAADAHLKPEDLAERFGLTRRQVLAFVAARKWPHERFGRQIRFTREQVEQIEAMHEVAVKVEPENPWGRRTRGSR